MTTEALRLGTKVRSMRRREKLTQSELAARLEISPSYLNLIEHQQRPLPAHLLVKLATIFKVDLSAFADDTQSRLAGDLQEVFGDVLFEEHPVTTTDMRELADNTTLARAVLALYQAYRGSVESTRALSTKLYDGRDFLGVDPTHLPSEEVNDVIQDRLNYFPEIEAAAEEFARTAKIDRKDAFRALGRYLQEAHGIQVNLAPASEPNVRSYDPERRILTVSETLPTWSRSFHVAHQVGRIVAVSTIQNVILNVQKNLTTPESLILLRVALANYFAAALLMPYDAFLAAAEETRYDIELLQHRFDVSFEQVCHRFTTLRKPGASGVSFHFVRVDIAGNISKRFSGTGIRFARFSGSCPRWDVHAAFLTPGRIRTQVSKMPDGTGYFCVARTVRKNYGGWGTPDTLMAVGIGCSMKDGQKLVYADGYDLDNTDAAVPIGTTCRLCERLDCEQRAFPPLQYGLMVDENVRGASFYAPAVAARPAPVPPAVTKKRKRS